jgi:hypothetical protein
VYERPFAQKPNHVLAIFATFVYFTERVAPGDGVIPFARSRHGFEQGGLHGGKGVIGHAPVLSAPQITERRFPGIGTHLGERQQLFCLHRQFAPEFTDCLDRVAIAGAGARTPHDRKASS